MSETLKREIQFTAAYDKRNPDPNKSYGIHGVEMRWLLTGENGAIQFVVYTGWHLPHVQRELDARIDDRFPHLSCHPNAADIGYHSYIPRYEGQSSVTEECQFLNGAKCYYDGSSLNAQKYLDVLISEGGEAVWKMMEQEYEYCLCEVEEPL